MQVSDLWSVACESKRTKKSVRRLRRRYVPMSDETAKMLIELLEKIPKEQRKMALEAFIHGYNKPQMKGDC